MIGENVFSKFFGCIIPRGKNNQSFSESEYSSSELQVHRHCLTWTIDNFNFRLEKKDLIKSCEFSAITDHQSKWCLGIKLSDRVCNDADKHSIDVLMYFIPARKGDTVFAISRWNLFNNERNKSWTGVTPTKEYKTVHGFNFKVKKTEILSCKKLIIRFNLTYTKNHPNNKFEEIPPSPIRIPENDHMEKFASLYKKDTFADVTFSLKGKNYTAHKAILAAQSPVFASMFEPNQQKGKVTCVKISGIDEDVFGEILKYIYTGKCENLDNLAHDLLIAADRYGLDRLKMICADALHKKLSVENATDTLILADKRGVSDLKSETIKFIAANYMEISKEEAWQNAIKKKPQLVHEVCQEFYRLSSAGHSST